MAIMVRIINVIPHKSVVKQAICRNCGCTLEYVPKDVKTVTSRDYGGGTDILKYIECPSCKATVAVQN